MENKSFEELTPEEIIDPKNLVIQKNLPPVKEKEKSEEESEIQKEDPEIEDREI